MTLCTVYTRKTTVNTQKKENEKCTVHVINKVQKLQMLVGTGRNPFKPP